MMVLRKESQPIFVELKKDNIKVYNKHEKTKEKGQAIKTGIEKIIEEDIIGIITVGCRWATYSK